MDINLNRASQSVVATDESIFLSYRRASRRRSSLLKENWTELKDESQKGEDGTGKVYEDYAPDGGYGWVIVLASLLNNFVLDGVAFSYGVLTSDIKTASNDVVGDFEFHLCGSVMLGVTLLVGPLVSVMIRPFGFRMLSIMGSVLACVGFLVAWATSPEEPYFWSLFFGFGILSGIGFGFMFTTSIVIVGLYFDKNRPLATGIAVTGSAVGSIIMPKIIEVSTNLWGWQGSIKTLALLCLLSGLFGAFYRPLPKRVVKGGDSKLELESVETKKSDASQILELLLSPTYLILAISGGITVLGYFVPSAFLGDKVMGPPFNVTKEEGTWLPAVIGASNTVGRVFFGILANSERAKYSLALTNGAVTFGGLATIWSAYATEYYQLILYAIVYGQIIAVYGTLRSIIIMDFLGEEKFNVGFGLSLFFMGFAALFGNALAAWLLETTGSYDWPFIAAGCLFVLSAVICYPLRLIDRKEKKAESKSGQRWAVTLFRRLSLNQA